MAKPSSCYAATWWWNTWAWSLALLSNSLSTLTNSNGLEEFREPPIAFQRTTSNPPPRSSSQYIKHYILDINWPVHVAASVRLPYLVLHTRILTSSNEECLFCVAQSSPKAAWDMQDHSLVHCHRLHYSITWRVRCGHFNCLTAFLVWSYTVTFILYISYFVLHEFKVLYFAFFSS